jgi:pilus assembly protein CpaF
LSLRFARHRPAGLRALVELGAMVPVTAQVLRALVHDRVSLVVTGGTGAGKTTLLAALLAECPAHERLVLVEDVRELDPEHPHVVRLQGRTPNVEGRGGVTLVDLVRQALRMRPDRLVVGEVRGAEVRELLAALNTGHDGGMSTLHANGPEELPARMEALAALAGMPRAAVHAQLRQALRAVVHVARDSTGRRAVRSIGVLADDPADPGVVRVELALRCDASGHRPGQGWQRLRLFLPSLDPPGGRGVEGSGGDGVAAQGRGDAGRATDGGGAGPYGRGAGGGATAGGGAGPHGGGAGEEPRMAGGEGLDGRGPAGSRGSDDTSSPGAGGGAAQRQPEVRWP